MPSFPPSSTTSSFAPILLFQSPASTSSASSTLSDSSTTPQTLTHASSVSPVKSNHRFTSVNQINHKSNLVITSFSSQSPPKIDPYKVRNWLANTNFHYPSPLVWHVCDRKVTRRTTKDEGEGAGESILAGRAKNRVTEEMKRLDDLVQGMVGEVKEGGWRAQKKQQKTKKKEPSLEETGKKEEAGKAKGKMGIETKKETVPSPKKKTESPDAITSSKNDTKAAPANEDDDDNVIGGGNWRIFGEHYLLPERYNGRKGALETEEVEKDPKVVLSGRISKVGEERVWGLDFVAEEKEKEG